MWGGLKVLWPPVHKTVDAAPLYSEMRRGQQVGGPTSSSHSCPREKHTYSTSNYVDLYIFILDTRPGSKTSSERTKVRCRLVLQTFFCRLKISLKKN